MPLKSKRSLVLYKEGVETRSDLLTLLSEACELEHGVACSYLYAAFSIKKNLGEFAPEQHQKILSWSKRIYEVARQEMLHLAQVWNILAAIGGTPYYSRPAFPQGVKYYPFNIPLKLEPFGIPALDRFILYELPSYKDQVKYCIETFGFASEHSYTYKTVGELYGMIRKGVLAIDESRLFIGDPKFQALQRLTFFKDIKEVTDRSSALKAIDFIVEQGEGTVSKSEGSHYHTFRKIREELGQELKESDKRKKKFKPAQNTITNPLVNPTEGKLPKGVTPITDPYTNEIADIFDDLYNLMMCTLQFVFANAEDPKIREGIARFDLQLMRILGSIGEVLTLLPAGTIGTKTAGAAFTMSRHVPFSVDPRVALTMINERMQELLARARDLASDKRKTIEVKEALATLEGPSKSLDDLTQEFALTRKLLDRAT